MAGVTKSTSTKRERREALERMTKAELVRTVVALDARQTKHLNALQAYVDTVALRDARIAELGKQILATGDALAEQVRAAGMSLPWEQG